MHKSVYRYEYRRSRDQDARSPVRRAVVVVGAGPVGLAAAIDLAQRGVPVVLLDDSDRIGEGSRGICWSKRTLEILDRLGVGERLVRARRHLEARQGLLRRRIAVFVRFAAGGGAQDARLHQSAAILSGKGAGRPRRRARKCRSALEEPRRRPRTAQRRRAADNRNAGRALIGSTPTGSSPPTARVRPCAACWASTFPASPSRTSS